MSLVDPAARPLRSSAFLTYGLPVAVAKMLPFAAVVVAGPLVGRAGVGAVAVVAAAIAISSVIGDSGLDAAATLRLSELSDPGRRAALLRGVVQARCALAGVAVVVVVAVTAPTSSVGVRVGLVVLATTAAIAQSVAAGMRVGLRVARPPEEVRALLVERVTVSAVFLALAGGGVEPALAYLAGWNAGPLIAVVLAPAGRRLALDLGHRADVQAVRQLLVTALPLAISAVAAVLYWRLDVLFLQHYTGRTAVGTYTYGYYPVMAISVVPGSAALLLLRRNSPAAVDHKAQAISAVAIGVIAGAVLAGPFALVAHAVLPHQFGSHSVEVLQIAAIGLPAIWLNPQVAMSLRANGYAWPVIVVSLGALAGNVVGNILVIPAHGVVGAAIVSTATEWLATLLLLPLLFRHVTTGPPNRSATDLADDAADAHMGIA